MTTTLDIIKGAMRKAGILTKSETPSSDEANDALQTLNDFLGSLSTESLFIPNRTDESFTLSGGVGEYTIGTGGAFNTSTPISIAAAYVRIGGVDYPLAIVSDQELANEPIKTMQGLPEKLNFVSSYPLGKIKLYPVPSGAYTLFLVTEKPLANLTMTQTLNLPAGWNRFLTYSLAAELAPEYGVSLPQEAAFIAVDAMAKVKRAVARNRSLDCEPKEASENLYSGWWN